MAALHGGRAVAQDVLLSGGVLELDAITVTATRSPEPTYGALSPSSVWTQGELQPLQADGVAEILDLVPSVNIQTTPDDPGAAVSIRGLQDFGRVNVMVDGARVVRGNDLCCGSKVERDVEVLSKVIERAEREDSERHVAADERSGHGANRAIPAAGDHGVESRGGRSFRLVVELVAGDAADLGVEPGGGEGVCHLAFRGRFNGGMSARRTRTGVAVEEGDDAHEAGRV